MKSFAGLFLTLCFVVVFVPDAIGRIQGSTADVVSVSEGTPKNSIDLEPDYLQLGDTSFDEREFCSGNRIIYKIFSP